MERRTTKPEAGNKYYISKLKGGWNPCIIIKTAPVDPDLDVLANCTAYATGRFNEALGLGECKYLGNHNAKSYVEYAQKQGLKVTQEPVIGGVMVWGGENQHVEFVEDISADGNTCYDTSSAYKKYIWDVRRRKRNVGGENQWGFNKETGPYLGCINPPYRMSNLTPVLPNETESSEELYLIRNGVKYKINLTKE